MWFTNILNTTPTVQSIRIRPKSWTTLGDGSSWVLNISQGYTTSNPQEKRNCFFFFFFDPEVGQGAAGVCGLRALWSRKMGAGVFSAEGHAAVWLYQHLGCGGVLGPQELP